MRPLRALERAADRGLLPDGAPLLVACSGGRDSMCLLDALHRLDRWPLAVATVDHGLHTASAEHARFVVDQARRRGLTGTVLAIAPSVLRGGEGPEARARAARYRALDAHLAAVGSRWLVTAHSADDQAETMLMRLGRGTGAHGLGAIPARRDHVVRPWLTVGRADIAQYAQRYDVSWVEDPSNTDRRFERNAVRHGPLAAMADIYGPAWTARASAAAERIRGERALLGALLDGGSTRLFGAQPEGVALRVQPARTLMPPARRALLAEALRRVAWAVDGRGVRRMAPHVDRLDQLLTRGGAPIELSPGVCAWRDGGEIVIGGRPASSPPPEPMALSGPGVYRWGMWRITVEAADASHPLAQCVSRAAAPWPWTVRTPVPGERFHPSGSTGHRTIARGLRDQHVARHLRRQIPVIVGEARTLFVGRLRADHGVRPSPGEAAWSITVERVVPKMSIIERS